MERFNLSSTEQVDAIYDYLYYQVENFLKMGDPELSDYSTVAFGALM